MRAWFCIALRPDRSPLVATYAPCINARLVLLLFFAIRYSVRVVTVR